MTAALPEWVSTWAKTWVFIPAHTDQHDSRGPVRPDALFATITHVGEQSIVVTVGVDRYVFSRDTLTGAQPGTGLLTVLRPLDDEDVLRAAWAQRFHRHAQRVQAEVDEWARSGDPAAAERALLELEEYLNGFRPSRATAGVRDAREERGT